MRQFDAQAVAAGLPWPELIEALEEGFRLGCAQPVRHHHTIELSGEPDATLLLMPAWRVGDVLGVKIATVYPGNAARGSGAVQATYVLASAESGVPLAVIDGLELTLRRTAAASALAARYLAREDASELLVLGTGNLAPHLARAHAAVRRYRRISVWGRRFEQAERVAHVLCAEGLPAIARADLEQAARSADVISCATLSRSPLVLGAWLSPGAHLDLVGGFTPQMRETDDEAISRGAVFVDTREGALAEAGDLIQPIAAGRFEPGGVQADLFELARGEQRGRSAKEQITVFKSVGAALEDLYAARSLWRAAAGD